MKGISDAIDAYTAVHTSLAHQDAFPLKTSNGTVEAIWIIHAVRRSASKTHFEVIPQIKNLLVTVRRRFVPSVGVFPPRSSSANLPLLALI